MALYYSMAKPPQLPLCGSGTCVTCTHAHSLTQKGGGVHAGGSISDRHLGATMVPLKTDASIFDPCVSCIGSGSRPNPGLLVLGRTSWLCSQSPESSGFLIIIRPNAQYRHIALRLLGDGPLMQWRVIAGDGPLMQWRVIAVQFTSPCYHGAAGLVGVGRVKP